MYILHMYIFMYILYIQHVHITCVYINIYIYNIKSFPITRNNPIENMMDKHGM